MENLKLLSREDLIGRIRASVAGFMNPRERKQLNLAIKIATEIHADQKPRPDGPYVPHVLRVALRYVLLTEGVADPQESDLATGVFAALLHDSVEDQAEKLIALSTVQIPEGLSKEAQALHIIEHSLFGESVAGMVSDLTNPSDAGWSSEESFAAYVEHVKHLLSHADVRTVVVKLADFYDNGVGIDSIPKKETRAKFCKRYLPIYDLFIRRIQEKNDPLPMRKHVKELVLCDLRASKMFALSELESVM